MPPIKQVMPKLMRCSRTAYVKAALLSILKIDSARTTLASKTPAELGTEGSAIPSPRTTNVKMPIVGVAEGVKTSSKTHALRPAVVQANADQKTAKNERRVSCKTASPSTKDSACASQFLALKRARTG